MRDRDAPRTRAPHGRPTRPRRTPRRAASAALGEGRGRLVLGSAGRSCVSPLLPLLCLRYRLRACFVHASCMLRACFVPGRLTAARAETRGCRSGGPRSHCARGPCVSPAHLSGRAAMQPCHTTGGNRLYSRGTGRGKGRGRTPPLEASNTKTCGSVSFWGPCARGGRGGVRAHAGARAATLEPLSCRTVFVRRSSRGSD
jgi:hypothetical protein